MRSNEPSQRRFRPLCFLDSSSSTSQEELGTLPFLATPTHHARSDEEEEIGGANLAAADGGAPPVLASCMAFLRRCCVPCREGGEGLLAAQERWQVASRVEKKLHARWALEDQLNSHLQRLESQLRQPIAAFHVSRMLIPPHQHAMEIAATSWLGGWRPSAILSVVPRLLAGGPAATLELSRRRQRFLDEAIRRFKVEEAVLDEEMAELCSMGLLSLLAGGAAVEELGKVAERAQQLRYGAVEIAVRRVMDAAQGVEFLVRFEGLQEALSRMGASWKSRVGNLQLALQY